MRAGFRLRQPREILGHERPAGTDRRRRTLMDMNRRSLLAILASTVCAGGAPARAGARQGIAPRNVKPAPRGQPSGRPFPARFTDVAAQAGLTHPSVYGGIDRKRFIVETVGCGVAFLDYDNDGWLDALVLSGTRLDGAPPGTTNRLYKNNRDGTFTDVTAKAGLTRTGWASAVTVGDYDNDGFDDLFITYHGHNVLYRNNGDGTFTDVTERAGLRQQEVRYGGGCTWVDYDRDGRLDLFVASYLNTTLERLPQPGANADCQWKGVPVNCGPRGLPHGSIQLFRNNGDGTFTDVSQPSGMSRAARSYPMTAVAADYDGDGWPDIYVACDSTPSRLFRNQRDGTFREEALERGVALSEDGMEQAGMGVAPGDYDLDGSPDIFKTHFADDTNGLYRNDGKGYFTDVTLRAGIGVETRYVGWGAGIADLDNDGWPDLLLVTGSVYPEVERTLPAYPFRTPRLVFHNLGNGRFEELIEQAGPGIAAVHASRGCAFGDFDNDGDVDVLVMNMNEPPSLLRNDVTGGGHWLKVLLQGVKSNRSAIGARVTTRYGGRVQAQDVTAQSSFYSVNDRRLHFGLGPATTADLTIRWPNGETESLAGIAADQLVIIREGLGIVERQRFG
jgi:enediyne biosynthesis protein E4